MARSQLGLHRLQSLAPVLEPDLYGARRHAELLREGLALVEAGQWVAICGSGGRRSLRGREARREGRAESAEKSSARSGGREWGRGFGLAVYQSAA